jgi:hypothetical protein
VAALCFTLYPLDMLLGFLPNMAILQFPWRHLAVATFGAAALSGFAALHLTELKPGTWLERLLPGALFAIMLFDFFPYTGSLPNWKAPYSGVYEPTRNQTLPRPLPMRVDFVTFPPSDPSISLSTLRRVYPEYFTPKVKSSLLKLKENSTETIQKLERAAVAVSFRSDRTPGERLNPSPYAELVGEGGKSAALTFTRGGERIRVELPGTAGTLTLKEQWFPGWDARIGDRPRKVSATADGLMTLKLRADDRGTLELSFSRTRWDRSLGIAMTVLTTLGLWLPWRRRSRTGPAGPTPIVPDAVDPDAAGRE